MTPSSVLEGDPVLRRVTSGALWVLPIAFLLYFNKEGLRCELQQDDFAWLGLRLEVHSFSDLMRVLFEPRAQGTVRTISERIFFLVYSTLFGTWALPYRVTAFAVQSLNLILLNAIGRRLSGSAIAGALGALLWSANASLAIPLSWTSAINQILCAFCIFGAFYFLLRFEQSGRTRDWGWQWLLYLLGFGMLELNVVYPVLASAYAILCARQLLRRTLLLWPPAIAYAVIHRTFSSSAAQGPYTLHFDRQMFDVFADLWGRTLGPSQLGIVTPVAPWFGIAGTLLLSSALIAFALVHARRANSRGLFLLLWFVVAIGPYLPLAEQRMNYYPFLAAAGPSLLAGWGLRQAWLRGKTAGVFAIALALLYLASSLLVARAQMFYYYVHGQRVKTLVDGVVQSSREHPGRTIFLSGIDEPVFWGSVYHHPFRLWGIPDVALLPDAPDKGTESYQIERARFERPFGADSTETTPIVLRLEDGVLIDVTDRWLQP